MNPLTSVNARYKRIVATIITLSEYLKYKIFHTSFCNFFREFRKEKALRELHYEVLRALDKEGFIVIENYLSPEQSEHAVAALKDSFVKYSNYVRSSDDLRIFGIQNVIPAALKLASEPLFEFFAEHVNSEQSSCIFTLGGWLQAGKSGSSGGGWHRDAFFSQFKAMLYLTDVSEKNGPFEILPGTHRLSSVLNATLTGGIRYMQDRISDEEVARLERVLNKTRRSIIGCAGTLVLFNSATIHRGRPIEEGERLALTNYYFPISYNTDSILKQFGPVLTVDKII